MRINYKAEHLKSTLAIPLDGMVLVHLITIVNRYNRDIYFDKKIKPLTPDLESLEYLIKLELKEPKAVRNLPRIGSKILASWESFKTIYFTHKQRNS